MRTIKHVPPELYFSCLDCVTKLVTPLHKRVLPSLPPDQKTCGHFAFYFVFFIVLIRNFTMGNLACFPLIKADSLFKLLVFFLGGGDGGKGEWLDQKILIFARILAR